MTIEHQFDGNPAVDDQQYFKNKRIYPRNDSNKRPRFLMQTIKI